MSKQVAKKKESPIASLNRVLDSPSVKRQFENALREKSQQFTASLIDLYGSDNYLQKCAAGDVVREALRAAVLGLPITKGLGYAWIVPYYSGKSKKFMPQFILGWRGVIQLAQRTGQYRFINCGEIWEGERIEQNRITGEITITGERNSDKAIGYFAYFRMLNGFEKADYWSKEKVEAHAIRYSQESKKAGKLAGNWLEHFDSRAMSTVLKHLIAKYGPMTVEMAQVVNGPDEAFESPADQEYLAEANAGEVIDIEAGELKDREDSSNKNDTRKDDMAGKSSQDVDMELADEDPGFGGV